MGPGSAAVAAASAAPSRRISAEEGIAGSLPGTQKRSFSVVQAAEQRGAGGRRRTSIRA